MSDYDPAETTAEEHLRLINAQYSQLYAVVDRLLIGDLVTGDFARDRVSMQFRAIAEQITLLRQTLHASKGGPFDIAADAVREGRIRDAVQIINQSSLDPGYVYMHVGAFRGHAQRLVVALRSERPRMEGLHAVQLLCEDVLGPITAAEICDRYVST